MISLNPGLHEPAIAGAIVGTSLRSHDVYHAPSHQADTSHQNERTWPADANGPLLRAIATALLEQGEHRDGAIALASSLRFEQDEASSGMLDKLLRQTPQLSPAVIKVGGRSW